MNKLHVIKIGGNIINSEKVLDAFLDDLAALKGDKILIHGGGIMATKLSEKLGISTQLINGRRVTSEEDLEVVTMVYAGLINKKITAQLQAKGCNAIGLSGADANCVRSAKRPIKPIDYGYVGDVKTVNGDMINHLFSKEVTPVFCAITHDGNGQLLNTNADTMAAEIAIAMGMLYNVELTYCFEKNGVLENVNDDNSVIPVINKEKYAALKEAKIIADGMLPKIENCFHALHNNVQQVIIGSPDVLKQANKTYTTLIL